MRFVTRSLAQAKGALLAQTVQAGPQRLRKGVVLTELMCQWLSAAGYVEVTIAELAPGDLMENDAAHAIAAALAIPGLAVEKPVNGRCNLLAEADGLFRVDEWRLARLNLLDEAITLTTLPNRRPVRTGQVVGTVKIIPMAVEATLLDHAITLAGAAVCGLVTYRPRRCALILTRSPLRKESILRKTETSMAARVAARGGMSLPSYFCAHDASALASGIVKARTAGADLILISGATAVADREDIAPRAIAIAGGRILRFGIPVFPGNLVCLGRVVNTDVLILPGCAGTLRPNGADWILDRLFTGEDVTAEDLALMGLGGLIEEETPTSSSASRAHSQVEA